MTKTAKKIAPTKICTLCGSQAYRTYEGMSGYVAGTKYDVYECSNCKSSFVDPMSNLKEEYDTIYGGDEKKDAIYNYYYYIAKGVKKLKDPLSALSDYTAIYWGVLKAIKDNHIKKGSKILEVGSGLGYFAYALNKSGYSCDGLDYSETAINFAKKFFGGKHAQGTIEEYAKTHKEEYDVVIATEVIEHVVDPRSFIGAFLEVLKPGGKIIITTPNKDVHPKGTIWETDHAPKHLWWFTEKGIEAVANNNHATVSFVDFTEYTRHKIWSINLGVANIPPNKVPVVNKEGKLLYARKKDYRDRVMSVLPAWLYLRIVGLYHDLKFLQRNKGESKYMYGIWAVFTKK